MPSFLDNFLTPLESVYKKAKEVAQPLFVNAFSNFGESFKKVGEGMNANPVYKDNMESGQSFLQQNAPGITNLLEGGPQKWYSEMQNPESQGRKNLAEAYKPENVGIGLVGSLERVGAKAISKVIPEVKLPVYKETGELTTKILKKLEGRSEVSKQFISDLTNSPDLKQTEKDIIRNVLEGSKTDKIPVQEFADKVKNELLPLKLKSAPPPRKGYTDWTPADEGGAAVMEDVGARRSNLRYESISLPEELRGNVANYDEHIWESPIKTSAGSTHFNSENIKNYFGHTRIEDMADNTYTMKEMFAGKAPKDAKFIDVRSNGVIKQGTMGTTRRVIEVQSDLYQKGNLEKESTFSFGNDKTRQKVYTKALKEGKSGAEAQKIAEMEVVSPRGKELQKLQQYNDPTAHFRMVREEVKQAAIDGKTKLQFPTGETAMKIEGLGESNNTWRSMESDAKRVDGVWEKLKPEQLNIGKHISNGNASWIITDVLGDGKFKAVPKEKVYEKILPAHTRQHTTKLPDGKLYDSSATEEFDISGKVDTNNPIYKFYEKDLGRYLKNKYNAKLIKDQQGVGWYELDVKPEMKGPVEAFGVLPFLPQKKKEENKELFISK